MKNIITILFLIFSTISLAQHKNTEPKIYDIVEVAPEFKGGKAKMYEYLSTNVMYPAEAIDANIQGKVYVQFIVTNKGKIIDAEIVKGFHELLDKEALRVIKQMPKWVAGKQKGKKVNVRYIIPINFKID